MRPPARHAHDLEIRAASATDAPALVEIYNPYVVGTAVTFEETPLAPADMASRVAEAVADGLPFLLAGTGAAPAGFAYASRWKGRCAYRHTCETTVYVGRDHWRRGVGTALYTRLLELLHRSGFHAAIGGIALPNDPSVALHERLGFEQVARFREVGFKFNQWIDVGYWQRLFA